MTTILAAVLGAAWLATAGGRPAAGGTDASIAISLVPQAAEGGIEKVAKIAGRVSGARRGQKIVLFAKSGIWWVQPFIVKPFTEINADATWSGTTHLGTEYAALLV